VNLTDSYTYYCSTDYLLSDIQMNAEQIYPHVYELINLI